MCDRKEENSRDEERGCVHEYSTLRTGEKIKVSKTGRSRGCGFVTSCGLFVVFLKVVAYHLKCNFSYSTLMVSDISMMHFCRMISLQNAPITLHFYSVVGIQAEIKKVVLPF